MALTVEDGTGLSDANVYTSLAFDDAYHDDRGNTKWEDASVADRESAKIRATDYIDKRWGVWFKGRKSSSTQARQWPRISAVDNNGYVLSGVPVLLQWASAEYALRALINNVLAPDPAQSVPGQNHETGSTVVTDVVTGEITETVETVGPITEKRVYRPASVGRSIRSSQPSIVASNEVQAYPEADLWMEELTRQSTSMKMARG